MAAISEKSIQIFLFSDLISENSLGYLLQDMENPSNNDLIEEVT